MTSEQLRYAIELANYHTMQRAADVLHITKSGLSRAIQQLEEELGVQLFSRTSAGTQLTEQGKQLLPLMQQELRVNFRLHQSATNLRHSATGRIVHFGYANTLLRPLVREYLATRKRDPHFSYLDLSQHPTAEIVRLVESGELDAGFIDADRELQQRLSHLDFHPIHTGGLSLFTSAQNALDGQSLTIENLRTQQYVMLKDPINQTVFDHLQSLCGPLEVVLQTQDYAIACEAVHQLDAVLPACGLLLYGAVENYRDYQLVEHPLTGLVDDHFTYGWISNPQHPLDKPTANFIARVCQRIEDGAKQD